MSAFIETIKTITDALRADSSLMGKVNKIAEYVPDKTPSPYISIEQAFSTPYRTHDRKGEAMFYDITIFSAKEGSKEGGFILNDVDRILGDNTSLCISGQDLIAIYDEGIQTFKEVINDVVHRKIVYRIRVLLTSK